MCIDTKIIIDFWCTKKLLYLFSFNSFLHDPFKKKKKKSGCVLGGLKLYL